LTAVLLPVLAALQYRWLGTLSELEHRRMASILYRASERFCDDLDRDVSLLYYELRSHLSEQGAIAEKLSKAYDDWAREMSFPELVKELHWITRGRHGGSFTCRRFDLSSHRLEKAEPPDWIENAVRETFESREHRVGALHPRVPALLVCDGGCAAVTFDREVLTNRIFPEHVREYFMTGDEMAYDVLVVDAKDPEVVVYRSAAALTFADFTEPDEEEAFFSLRTRSRRSATEHWRLLIRHRAGSLEKAVTATRLRNLAVAFGALILLGASMVLLVVTTRRANALARQQVEFVAGVSHELRTPLAGISSLSENLADGVIQDPERTREYGQAINRETHRLGDMLERVLIFSRMQSGKPYEMRRLDLAETIGGAIQSAGSWVVEKSADITPSIPEELPPVVGNPRALKMVFQNILVNALKFSPEGSTIRIGVTEAGGELRIAVEDPGCGIASSELSHIFEPFYRGTNAREQQVEGSGLGLSIVKRTVEAQGGRITVKSELGKGTTITVHLPIAESADVP
jgi:signal transduction histidine kinase